MSQLAKEYIDIVLSGHLADYRYYDMNVAVLMALEKFNNEINI
jgi:UDP-galactopyranose mutase